MSILCRSREFRYKQKCARADELKVRPCEQSLSFLAPKLPLHHLPYVLGITARLKSASVKSDA